MIIYTPHKPDEEKLKLVMEHMEKIGPPEIKGYWTGEYWQAIEGSHRVPAAAKLGLVPIMTKVDLDSVIDGHDIYDLDQGCTVADILSHLYSCPEIAWEFDVDHDE